MNDQPIDTSFLRLYAETRGFMLGRPAKPKFSPDGKTVFFLRSEAKNPKQKLFAFDVESKKTKELLSPEMLLGGKDEQLSAEEKARRERQRITAGGFADYHLSPDGAKILVSLSGRLFVFDRTTEKHAELKTGPGSCLDPKWSPDGKMVGYVRGFDVYAFDLASGKETAVTTGGTSVKTNGLAEFVAQEEMGRHSGFWWSPDSKQIAFAEADHTGVEQWAVADPLNPDKLGSPQYYPRPGKKNVSVRLGIATLGSGKVVWVEWDRKKYEYLANLYWLKCGMLAILQDRKQQEQDVCRINPADGSLRTLIGSERRESGRTWKNLPNRIIECKEGFLWLDEHDQLGICDSHNGKLIFDFESKPLLFIRDIVDCQTVNISGEEYSQVYLLASHDSSQLHVYRYTIANGQKRPTVKSEKLSTVEGNHSVVPQPGGCAGYLITSTTKSTMPVSELYDGTGKVIGTLPSVAVEPEKIPRAEYHNSLDRLMKGPANPGGLTTVIYKPQPFDATKRYPVIIDVYGGPRHLHVVQAMRNGLIPQWLADQGFIVVAIDNRGTPGNGYTHEKDVYQKFGTVPLEDQIEGLKVLAQKNLQMDLSRVGIVGWSFGGYMAANAVLRRPDVFHAAVAGAPVTDWEDYDTHYTERYLGVLPESRKAYDEASLIPLAKDLKRPLLLIHGTADDNVYYRHTLKLSDAIFRAGKTCEVLPLPGVTHMYTADPQVAERMWERTVRFFKRELGGVK